MSKFTELFHKLLEIDDKYKAPDKLMKILHDREKREEEILRGLYKTEYKTKKDILKLYSID